MIRIAAVFWFSMTLLCPVFCLADEGGECSDLGRADGGNCDAMAVGAVVAESQSVADSSDRPSAAVPPFAALARLPVSLERSRLATWNRASSRPPPAAVRRALLQSFLF